MPDSVTAVTPGSVSKNIGDAAAQTVLGIMYADGDGVPENDAEAVRWFRLAAEHWVEDYISRNGRRPKAPKLEDDTCQNVTECRGSAKKAGSGTLKSAIDQLALTRLRTVAQQKGKLKAFNKAVNRINQTYGYRETPKFLLVIMNGNLHRVALEVGGQFVVQGRLQHREQVFDLHMNQIGQAQRDESLQLLPLIEENLEPYKQMQKVKQFPCFIDSRGKIIRKVIEAKDGDLAGLAVSNGVIRGRAKVLKSPYEKPLLSGEILVTVATEPAWTPVFINAAGVVLEVGGGLQHGAIIAKEYGIPCVSGLPGVTDLIKDGDLLEVDGSNGIVKIVDAFPTT